MSGKVPPSSRAASRSGKSLIRPATRNDIARAADLYERFTGHEAETIGKIRVPKMPAVGVAIGEIDFVGYTTVRDGKTEAYIHKFNKRDKPLFVVSPDGKSLHLIGGNYTFTERGIVDKSHRD